MRCLGLCLMFVLGGVVSAGCGSSSDAPDELASVCPPGPCDLVAQDCTHPDDACYFAEPAGGGEAAPMCLGQGAGEEGDPCMLPNDCVTGLLCIGPTGEMGTCRGVCCLNADDGCSPGLECLIPIAGPGPSDTGVGACAVPDECDLLMQNCAGAADCYPSVKEGVAVCVAGGQLVEGDACEFANDCAGGLICTEGECTRICDRSESGESGCDEDQVCVELLGFPSTVGVCDPPS
jgi:hypothetical protein